MKTGHSFSSIFKRHIENVETISVNLLSLFVRLTGKKRVVFNYFMTSPPSALSWSAFCPSVEGALLLWPSDHHLCVLTNTNVHQTVLCKSFSTVCVCGGGSVGFRLCRKKLMTHISMMIRASLLYLSFQLPPRIYLIASNIFQVLQSGSNSIADPETHKPPFHMARVVYLAPAELCHVHSLLQCFPPDPASCNYMGVLNILWAIFIVFSVHSDFNPYGLGAAG